MTDAHSTCKTSTAEGDSACMLLCTLSRRPSLGVTHCFVLYIYMYMYIIGEGSIQGLGGPLRNGHRKDCVRKGVWSMYVVFPHVPADLIADISTREKDEA